MQNTIFYSKIAKNTMMLYFRMLLNMIVSFYTSRIVLDALGIDDFGIYNVVGGIVVLFTFLNTAMSSATQRFLTFELGKKSGVERLSKVFSTSLNIHVLISFFIVILSETIGLYFLNEFMVIPSERMVAANVVYQCSILSCIMGIMTLPFNAIIVSYEYMDVFAWISIFDVILKLVIAYLLYITFFDKLIVYSVLLFLVTLITSIIYVLYCYKKFPECKYRCVRDRSLFKSMCSFAGWNLIGNFAYICFTQGLNILLNMFFGPAVNAARGIAVQMQGVIGRFAGSFQIAVNPQITKKYAANNMDGMYLLLYKSSKISFFLLFIVSYPIILQTENILNFWLVDVPNYTVSFFRIIICISMIEVLANPLNIGAQATGKVKKYQIMEGGTLLFILPLSFFMLKIFHRPEVVFIVHLVIAIIVQYIRVLLLNKMIGLSIKDYFKDVILQIIMVSTASVVLIYVMCVIASSLMDNFFVCTIMSVVIIGVLIFAIGLTNQEKFFIIEFIRKVSKYKK